MSTHKVVVIGESHCNTGPHASSVQLLVSTTRQRSMDRVKTACIETSADPRQKDEVRRAMLQSTYDYSIAGVHVVFRQLQILRRSHTICEHHSKSRNAPWIQPVFVFLSNTS